MDTNFVLRDGSTDLTQDETLTSVRVGPMIEPLWLHVVVPEVSADNLLDVELEFCAAAAPTTQIYNMNMAQISAAGHYAIPFITALEYLQAKLNLDDNPSGPDLGATKVWIDNANRGVGDYNS